MLIKIAISIPAIKQENLNNEIEFITKSLLMTKEKVQIIGKSLKMQSALEKELLKNKIEQELKALAAKNPKTKIKLNEFISKNSFFKDIKYELIPLNTKEVLNKWFFVKTDAKNRVRPINFFRYNIQIKSLNKTLSVFIEERKLNPNHKSFELNLKKSLITKTLNHPSLKSSQTAIIRLAKDLNTNDILLEEDIKKRRKKYHFSMMSNAKNVPTGNLTIKQILEARDLSYPIKHTVNGTKKLIWVINLKDKLPKDGKNSLIIHSVDKKELENKNSYNILFLFPETFIAIFVSFLIIILLIRKILEGINKITATAKLANKGDITVRSNVKGENDIGILGESFDSMLDSFEYNINALDEKVEEKTKEIRASLAEKEILLREIHHRVKNNLALTIGLIELQEEEVEDDKIKGTLEDIKERIFTMELLHRKLYESKNLDNIPCKEYISDLVKSIAKSYDFANKVTLNLKIEDVKLTIDKALPCGIILNELVTNAFKYAFMDNNEHPKLELHISYQNDDFKMIFKDNGKGLENDFEKINQKTLGLKLINTIVKYQLYGDIKYKYDNGAKFIITSKIK